MAALTAASSAAWLHNMSDSMHEPHAHNVNEAGRALSLTPEQQVSCQKYANRTFVPLSEQKHPTLLWTFPGSGSGWVRLLIEHATGPSVKFI